MRILTTLVAALFMATQGCTIKEDSASPTSHDASGGKGANAGGRHSAGTASTTPADTSGGGGGGSGASSSIPAGGTSVGAGAPNSLDQGGSTNSAGTSGRSSTPGGTNGGTSAPLGTAGSVSASGGVGQTTTTNPTSGALPVELLGVWQQTRATTGSYQSSDGTSFTLTSGFSVQLKLSSSGAYYLANFGSGVSSSCATVTQYEQSVGQAALVGSTLVFTPSAHVIDVSDCNGQRRVDLGIAAFSLTITLQEAEHFYGGIRTYRMLANGGPHPYDLMLVHRPPLANPTQPTQPASFTLGSDGPYREFVGLWVAAAGTDSNFFNPNTGEYYFPELNGSPHAWLRMGQDGYETAIALQNVNSDGPCKSDIIYYEQGTAQFAVLEDVGGQGNHYVGHTRLTSTSARYIVRIRNCDESDGTVVYDLPGLPRYFRFIYFSPGAPPESISFPCEFPLSEWQSILCEAFPKGFIRRQ